MKPTSFQRDWHSGNSTVLFQGGKTLKLLRTSRILFQGTPSHPLLWFSIFGLLTFEVVSCKDVCTWADVWVLPKLPLVCGWYCFGTWQIEFAIRVCRRALGREKITVVPTTSSQILQLQKKIHITLRPKSHFLGVKILLFGCCGNEGASTRKQLQDCLIIKSPDWGGTDAKSLVLLTENSPPSGWSGGGRGRYNGFQTCFILRGEWDIAATEQSEVTWTLWLCQEPIICKSSG